MLTGLLLTGTLAFAAHAQAPPTNLEVYQMLAGRCLSTAPGTTTAFHLSAPSLMPYVRTTLVQAWQSEARTLYVGDAADAPAVPTLQYTIDEVALTYARANRKALARNVVLGLSYTLTAPDGQLLGENRCRETYDDVIARGQQEALEQATYPETQGTAPPPGWMRRYLEPVVLGAATVVTVVLFFSLRSDRANDGT